MKKIFKALFVMAFLTIGVWALTAKPAFYSASAQAIRKAGKSSPKKLYTQNCARCHGADGKSETTIGKSLDAPDLTGSGARSVKRVTNIITNGKEDMPAFGKKLSKADIKSLVAYVRRF